MSRLTLTLKAPLRHRLNMRPLTRDHAEALGKGPRAVAKIPLYLAGDQVALGDIFRVTGTAMSGQADDHLIIAGDDPRLDGLGAGWHTGSLTITGDCGDGLGENMTGGTIRAQGHVGHHTARGMAGGHIHIAKNAGDHVGGALTGHRVGMTGGTVHIGGNAGHSLGERMRRGLILVAGRTGDYCAAHMIAGTICVLGPIGPKPGLAMRRGTLLLATKPPPLAATFGDCGVHDLPFLALLLRHIAKAGPAFAAFARRAKHVHRYAGDTSVDGQGEILIPPKQRKTI